MPESTSEFSIYSLTSVAKGLQSILAAAAAVLGLFLYLERYVV